MSSSKEDKKSPGLWTNTSSLMTFNSLSSAEELRVEYKPVAKIDGFEILMIAPGNSTPPKAPAKPKSKFVSIGVDE